MFSPFARCVVMFAHHVALACLPCAAHRQMAAVSVMDHVRHHASTLLDPALAGDHHNAFDALMAQILSPSTVALQQQPTVRAEDEDAAVALVRWCGSLCVCDCIVSVSFGRAHCIVTALSGLLLLMLLLLMLLILLLLKTMLALIKPLGRTSRAAPCSTGPRSSA